MQPVLIAHQTVAEIVAGGGLEFFVG